MPKFKVAAKLLTTGDNKGAKEKKNSWLICLPEQHKIRRMVVVADCFAFIVMRRAQFACSQI